MSLEGISKEPTDTLFIGIFPPLSPIAAQLTQVALQLRDLNGLWGNPIATERFHITLHKLGRYDGVPPHIVANASRAAASIAPTFQPFSVTFDRAYSFLAHSSPSNRPFVLHESSPSPALQELFRALGSALGNHNVPNSGKSAFTPHITLLYDAKDILDQPVQPLTWRVTEFVLIHSLHGQTIHRPLGRWTLGASHQATG